MKHLKCKRAGSCRGVSDRAEGGGGSEGLRLSLLESLLGEGEEKEGGERACAAGGRKHECSLSEGM